MINLLLFQDLEGLEWLCGNLTNEIKGKEGCWEFQDMFFFPYKKETQGEAGPFSFSGSIWWINNLTEEKKILTLSTICLIINISRISQENIIASPNIHLHFNDFISNFLLNKALIKKSGFRE